MTSRFCVAERAEYGVHAGLIPGAFRFEPLEDVGVDAQGDRGFGRRGHEAPTNDGVDDVSSVDLGMLPGRNTGLT